MHAREHAADKNDPGPSGEGRFASAPNDVGPDLVLRTGVLRFGSAVSRHSRNGFGTLRTTKRYTVRRNVAGSLILSRALWS